MYANTQTLTHSHTQGSACIIGPTCAEAQKHASLLFWAVNEGLPLSNLPSGHSHPFLLFLSLSPIPPLSVTYFLSLPPSLPSSHSPCHLFVSYGIFHIFLFLSVAVSISLPPSSAVCLSRSCGSILSDIPGRFSTVIASASLL